MPRSGNNPPATARKGSKESTAVSGPRKRDRDGQGKFRPQDKASLQSKANHKPSRGPDKKDSDRSSCKRSNRPNTHMWVKRPPEVTHRAILSSQDRMPQPITTKAAKVVKPDLGLGELRERRKQALAQLAAEQKARKETVSQANPTNYTQFSELNMHQRDPMLSTTMEPDNDNPIFTHPEVGGEPMEEHNADEEVVYLHPDDNDMDGLEITITNDIEQAHSEETQPKQVRVGPYWFDLVLQESTQVPAPSTAQASQQDEGSYTVENVYCDDQGTMVAMEDFPWDLCERALMADQPLGAVGPATPKPTPVPKPTAPIPYQPNLAKTHNNVPHIPQNQPPGQRRRRHNSQARRERNYARMQMFRERNAARRRPKKVEIPKPAPSSTYIPSLLRRRVRPPPPPPPQWPMYNPPPPQWPVYNPYPPPPQWPNFNRYRH